MKVAIIRGFIWSNPRWPFANTSLHTRKHDPVPAVLSHTLKQGLISAAVAWRAQREDRTADTRASWTLRLLTLSNRRCSCVYASVCLQGGARGV